MILGTRDDARLVVGRQAHRLGLVELRILKCCQAEQPIAKGRRQFFLWNVDLVPVSEVRLGGARQHLDMVLMYEVSAHSQRHNTPLAVFDLTIIGGALLPTRGIEAEGAATALLVDVVNGYPYGSTSVQADISGLANSWGASAQSAQLLKRVSLAVVDELTPKVGELFTQLYMSYVAKAG